jgi:hypothetical protein
MINTEITEVDASLFKTYSISSLVAATPESTVVATSKKME